MNLPTLIEIGEMYGMPEAYCFATNSEWYGWLFHKNEDGDWTSWRQAGPIEREAIEENYKRKTAENG